MIGEVRMRVLACLILLAGAEGCRSRATAVSAATTMDGLALFCRFTSVLRHPRCLACHGGMDITSAADHPGGAFPFAVARRGSGCAACHDAASARNLTSVTAEPTSTPVEESAWHPPGHERDFVGKTDRQLCLQMRDAFPGLPHDPSDLFEHIDHDERILLGFTGARAIHRRDLPTSPPQPPPMSHLAFVTAVREWVERGGAGCEPAGPSAGQNGGR